MSSVNYTSKIAVVIPSYRVKAHILDVIREIPSCVSKIYVVDDCCPDRSGDFVSEQCTDPRVEVVRNPTNMGVGGAVMAGYKAAIEQGMEILVKIDGDGQMDPKLLPSFIEPIANGEADYTKGNRFFSLEQIGAMPGIRIFGNAALSFLTKISSGYWDIFDPTNGYTAIHADVARQLPFQKISRRYFFETDILFRLNTLRAVVLDIPMDAKYADETSNLKISKILGEFLLKHLRNLSKRIFYNYYLRDLSLASFELPLGIVLIIFGVIFGSIRWIGGLQSGIANPTGTIMLAAISILLGTQIILAFIGHDIASVPQKPLHKRLKTFNLLHRQPYK